MSNVSGFCCVHPANIFFSKSITIPLGAVIVYIFSGLRGCEGVIVSTLFSIDTCFVSVAEMIVFFTPSLNVKLPFPILITS